MDQEVAQNPITAETCFVPKTHEGKGRRTSVVILCLLAVTVEETLLPPLIGMGIGCNSHIDARLFTCVRSRQ